LSFGQGATRRWPREERKKSARTRGSERHEDDRIVSSSSSSTETMRRNVPTTTGGRRRNNIIIMVGLPRLCVHTRAANHEVNLWINKREPIPHIIVCVCVCCLPDSVRVACLVVFQCHTRSHICAETKRPTGKLNESRQRPRKGGTCVRAYERRNQFMRTRINYHLPGIITVLWSEKRDVRTINVCETTAGLDESSPRQVRKRSECSVWLSLTVIMILRHYRRIRTRFVFWTRGTRCALSRINGEIS